MKTANSKMIRMSILIGVLAFSAAGFGVTYYDIILPSYPSSGVLYDAANLNDFNQIVGPAGSSFMKAYLWQTGTISYLPFSINPEGTYANDINNNGKIVGGPANGWDPGLLLDGSNVISLGTLGGDSSKPYAINDNNQVVGSSQTNTINEIAPFLWQNASMTNLGSLGGTYGRAYDINNSGTVVGISKNVSGYYRGFVCLQGATMADLGTLGGNQSVAAAVNDANEVVGWAEMNNGYQHAFFWKKGVMTDLGTLGGNQSQAFSINNGGLILGWAETETGYRPLVIWENGVAVRLNQLVAPDSGWELVFPGESNFDYRSPFSINNNGCILGYASINEGKFVFLMIPRPEDFFQHDSNHDGTVNLQDFCKLSAEWMR